MMRILTIFPILPFCLFHCLVFLPFADILPVFFWVFLYHQNRYLCCNIWKREPRVISQKTHLNLNYLCQLILQYLSTWKRKNKSLYKHKQSFKCWIRRRMGFKWRRGSLRSTSEKENVFQKFVFLHFFLRPCRYLVPVLINLWSCRGKKIDIVPYDHQKLIISLLHLHRTSLYRRKWK